MLSPTELLALPAMQKAFFKPLIFEGRTRRLSLDQANCCFILLRYRLAARCAPPLKSSQVQQWELHPILIQIF
jgi:hypothetical protein